MLISLLNNPNYSFGNSRIKNVQSSNLCYNNKSSDVFFSSRKLKNEKENLDMQNDEDIKKQIEHDKIVRELRSCNYESIVSDLINKGEFNPSDHYIGIDKNDEYPVFIKIQYSSDNFEYYDYSVNEFEDVLLKLRDSKIELYPEEKENYIDLTNKLMDKLRK